jgi:hypothetical protein
MTKSKKSKITKLDNDKKDQKSIKDSNISSAAVYDKSKDRKYSVHSTDNPNLDWRACTLLTIVIFVTFFCYPSMDTEKVTIHQVWYYGWITAVSTGIGVLPFYIISNPDTYWRGISNGKYILFYIYYFFIIIIITINFL